MRDPINEVRRFGLKDDGSQEIVYVRMQAEMLVSDLCLNSKEDTTVSSCQRETP